MTKTHDNASCSSENIGIGLLSTLLKEEGLNPATTKLVRHSINEKTGTVRRCFQKGFIEDYQSIQERPVFHKCSHILVFMGEKKGTTGVFLGLYEVKREIEGDHSQKMPEGYPSPEQFKNDRYWYDLAKSDDMSRFEGRLIIEWGRGTLAWCQKATNEKVIIECPELH